VADEPVRVTAYAGGRGEEAPRAFFLGDERIEVEEILRTWIEEERGGGQPKRCFDVRGRDGRRHLLCYDEDLRIWLHRTGRKSPR
jgi:hypothetical protein